MYSFQFLKAASFLVIGTSLFLILLLIGCGDDDSPSTPASDTTAPTVSIVASQNMVTTPSELTLTATASDEKSLASVTFFDGELELFSDTEVPFVHSINLTQVDNRLHSYKAVATDGAGNSGESENVEVMVYIDPQVGFINGGFELGSEGWTLFHFDQWSGWTEETGNPPGCMRLNEFGDCAVDPGVTQQVSGLMPGVSFTVSGEYRPYVSWLGNPSAESFVVTVDSLVIGSFARGVNGEDWSSFSVDFTATATTHNIGFWAEYSCDDSSYELDNVVFSLTP